MALVAHWMGCLFYYVSRTWASRFATGSFPTTGDSMHGASSVEDFFANTWGEADGLWRVQYVHLTQNVTTGPVVEFGTTSRGNLVMLQPLSYRYLRALYWAMITMVTTGFGDIVPYNENETLVCIMTVTNTAETPRH